MSVARRMLTEAPEMLDMLTDQVILGCRGLLLAIVSMDWNLQHVCQIHQRCTFLCPNHTVLQDGPELPQKQGVPSFTTRTSSLKGFHSR